MTLSAPVKPDTQHAPAQGMVQVIIHGHFYQPPRENPFTGQMPIEHGAEPFTNFNEKINAECYRPNAALGNFERISFNFGPTLAAWVEKADPVTYKRIVASARAVYERYGCSNAMAQAYNHTILPLARPHDARMQIAWGLADFEQRFGFKPEGMWLAETGANAAVLEMLADAGIKFVILAPWQADYSSVETIDPQERAAVQGRLRAYVLRGLSHQFGGDERLNWAAMQALERAYVPEPFEPCEPYKVELRGGKSIAVFFYNGPLSGGVSFDPHATTDADNFAHNWLMPQINTDKLGNNERQVIMVATDGELYGHHKSYRDYFLERLTTHSIQSAGMELTFPALYLRQNPPRRRIRIVGNTSWSCHHGVKRWGEGCECTPGDTSWKRHLRQAFDILAVEADRILAIEGKPLFKDSRDALRDYLAVYLKQESMETFAARHFKPRLSDYAQRPDHPTRAMAERLLLAQIYKHQMYTSCAWFFEDIDRIEPKNALAAAAMCLRLLGRLVRSEVRHAFEQELALAVSNHPRHITGLQLYHRGQRQNPAPKQE